MSEYNPQEIEPKWQQQWLESGAFAIDTSVNAGKRESKEYILDMFPYPSGAGLHVGHPEGYTATDIVARYQRMNGRQVMHPMGWDAFGLPAENYAIKSGIDPATSTSANIETFRRQIRSLGFSYDWNREIDTSSPEYYKWTQWIFLQMYNNGLAYKKNAKVNWCNTCQTVLANEQVIDGKCERTGDVVIQKDLEQWFFKTTDYAEELLTGLEGIDWPEPITLMQRNWIGKSEGAELVFPVEGHAVKRAVLLHGRGGSPETNFFPWLTAQLELHGIEVVVPALPNPKEPVLEEQVAYVVEHCSIDENTLVLGHSFGGLVAMHVLASDAVAAAAKLVLVATPSTDNFRDGKPRPTVSAAINTPVDFELIKERVQNIEILSDLQDEVVPTSDADVWGNAFAVPVTEAVAHETHFCAAQEPQVLEASVPSIRVYTTRPDTLFGATYVVLAPEHPLVDVITTDDQRAAIDAYKATTAAKTDLERTGLAKEKTGEFTGAYAVNPANGEKIPVWIADYALITYGTGAVMAVPGHDERDHEFAKVYNLPIVQVIAADDANIELAAYTEGGVMMNSGEFDGMPHEEAKWAITEKVGGIRKTNYKLRDWLISRQRYWGAPIPIVYDPQGNPHPVKEEHLPLTLPTDVDYRPKGTSPLGSSESYKALAEELYGEGWHFEVDTMDTFVCSSWYYLRFTDPKNEAEFASQEAMKTWLPIDLYVGGAEHAVLHLLYARFFYKALGDFGFIAPELGREPFLKLRNQGMILGPDGQKMSKSKGNVINPDDVVNELGADTLRIYEMFMGPLEDPKPWSTESIKGVRRFLDRVWKVSGRVQDVAIDEIRDAALLTAVHQTITKVGSDIEAFKFNTAVSQMMICVQVFERAETVPRELFGLFVRVLSPFAPHIAEELWQQLGNSELISLSQWPQANEAYLVQSSVTIGVQVNGKMRGTIKIAPDTDEATAVAAAQEVSGVQSQLEGKTIAKVIYVPGKILNLIVK